MMLFYGPHLQVRYINAMMVSLLGRPRAEIIGKPDLAFLGRFVSRDDVAQALLKSYTSKEPCFLPNTLFWSYPMNGA